MRTSNLIVLVLSALSFISVLSTEVSAKRGIVEHIEKQHGHSGGSHERHSPPKNRHKDRERGGGRYESPRGNHREHHRGQDRSKYRERPHRNRHGGHRGYEQGGNHRHNKRHHYRKHHRKHHRPSFHSYRYYPRHNYYPSTHRGYYGHIVAHLPHGFIHLIIDSLDYYYHDGTFYRPVTGGYAVVGVPPGTVLSALPKGYRIVLLGGTTYYVVGDSYFIQANNGYMAVARPDVLRINSAPAAAAPNTETSELYIYPKQGQSMEQQARDRYECHSWGSSQSGYDSTQTGPWDDKRENYRRAMSACLEGRGYTVK